MDFMYDVLENKRSYRILNVIDDHSRECLCCEVSRSFGGYDVAEALDRAMFDVGWDFLFALLMESLWRFPIIIAILF